MSNSDVDSEFHNRNKLEALLIAVACRKRLAKLPATPDGLDTFKQALQLISCNAHTFAKVLADNDLESSADLFAKKAEEVYAWGSRWIESYGNETARGH